jgi:predicted transcriptional regulator
MKHKRRSKMHILLDMLLTIDRKGGAAKPTHILYGANLSHNRLKEYLEFLLEKEFIEETTVKGRLYYRITDKGMAFIREFEKIEELSSAFGIPF